MNLSCQVNLASSVFSPVEDAADCCFPERVIVGMLLVLVFRTRVRRARDAGSVSKEVLASSRTSHPLAQQALAS